jgi:hypothetical protein
MAEEKRPPLGSWSSSFFFVTTPPWGKGNLYFPGIFACLLYAFLLESSDAPK